MIKARKACQRGEAGASRVAGASAAAGASRLRATTGPHRACRHRRAVRKSRRARIDALYLRSPRSPRSPFGLGGGHPDPPPGALDLRAVLRRRAGDGLSGLGLAGRLPLRDRAGAPPRPGPLVEPLVLRRLPRLGLRRGGDQLHLPLRAALLSLLVSAGAAAGGGGRHLGRRPRRLPAGRPLHPQPRLARVRGRHLDARQPLGAAGRLRAHVAPRLRLDAVRPLLPRPGHRRGPPGADGGGRRPAGADRLRRRHLSLSAHLDGALALRHRARRRRPFAAAAGAVSSHRRNLDRSRRPQAAAGPGHDVALPAPHRVGRRRVVALRLGDADRAPAGLRLLSPPAAAGLLGLVGVGRLRRRGRGAGALRRAGRRVEPPPGGAQDRRALLRRSVPRAIDLGAGPPHPALQLAAPAGPDSVPGDLAARPRFGRRRRGALAALRPASPLGGGRGAGHRLPVRARPGLDLSTGDGRAVPPEDPSRHGERRLQAGEVPALRLRQAGGRRRAARSVRVAGEDHLPLDARQHGDGHLLRHPARGQEQRHRQRPARVSRARLCRQRRWTRRGDALDAERGHAPRHRRVARRSRRLRHELRSRLARGRGAGRELARPGRRQGAERRRARGALLSTEGPDRRALPLRLHALRAGALSLARERRQRRPDISA